MKIVVCIKQVPAASSVKIDPATGRLIREGIESVLNPFDCHALEAALMLRPETGAEVIALTLGPAAADAVLREALALGCDRAILLSDRAFAGSDTWATGYILRLAIEKIGEVGLVLCGKQAIDGDTAQVGPELAAQLGFAQACGVTDLAWQGGAGLKLHRTLDHGGDVIALALPAVVAVERELNVPRVPRLTGYLRAEQTEVPVWSAADLAANFDWIGLHGSPTRVAASRAVQLRRRDTRIIAASAREAARELNTLLSFWKGAAHV